MNKIVWTDRALANLQAIRAYIAQFNPKAANAVAGELIATGNSLANFAHQGRIVPKTRLRELLSAAPYIIRYRIDGETVVTLRVRHGARRPAGG